MTLTCKYCAKSFEKAATCKRHQYYCFHKQNEPRTTRKRSCVACVRAKTRCDQQVPSCGRCRAKRRSCDYEGREGNSNIEASLELTTKTSPSQVDIRVQNHESKLEFRMDALLGMPDITLDPSVTSSGYSLRLMSSPFGKKADLGSVGAMFIIALRSVLHTVSQDTRCPPFLHPDQPNDQSFLRCREIMARYFSSKQDLWPEIRQEHERIWFSHDTMQGWELLSALQALLIYCLLRATYGSPSDLDLPLIVSVKEVSIHLGKLYSWHARRETPGYREVSHEEWKFMEAWVRTITMFRLMWLVWDFDDFGPCDGTAGRAGFLLIPLPSHDVLWQARTAHDWRPKFENREAVVHGFTQQGVLVKLGCNGRGISWSEPSWEAWIAEVGEIGMLCGMAAQMLKSTPSLQLDEETVKNLLPEQTSAEWLQIESSINDKAAVWGGQA